MRPGPPTGRAPIAAGSDTDASAAAVQPGSRDRLVAAAVELILEHHSDSLDPRAVFSFLTPRSVAERAGLSRGLIYHHWGAGEIDGSEAFSQFLGAVADELWHAVSIPEDLADLAAVLPDNLSDVVATLATVELERLSGAQDALWRTISVLLLYGFGSVESTEGLDRLSALYRRVLEKLDREPVPPLDERDIAFAVMCLLDGFTLNRPVLAGMVDRVHPWTPTVPPVNGDGGWTLLAIGIESLALNMTRPIARASTARDSAVRLEPEHAPGQADDEHLT